MSLTIEHAEHVTIHVVSQEAAGAQSILGTILSTEPSLADALTPPAPGTYWQSQGGIYVGTVPAMLGAPARHLVVSQDEAKRTWGGYDHETSGAGSHVDGPANTAALLADGQDHPAATWCKAYTADGHSDFHLPSRFDLLIAYLTAPQVFNTDGWYWSSTQFSRHFAFVQDFAFGSSDWNGKDLEFRVRAFRWIHFGT